MMYIYPKLSEIDLGLVRIGGLGLGNMLFPYARALLYARDHGGALIWPTWASLPAGQILRRDSNKRFYNDLFINRIAAVSGFKKAWLLLTGQKVSEKEYKEENPAAEHQINAPEETLRKKILLFTGMEGEFTPLLGKGNSRFLYEHFKRILREENRAALAFEPGNGICVHVRLGDFTKGSDSELKAGLPNKSIPIAWYVGMIGQLREALGRDVPAYVFSDGSDEELCELLKLPRVERKTFGTAIADIMAMTNARLFIASGSTFSGWVRFLGQMNTIAYPGQLKQRLLEDDTDHFEIEAETIPERYLKILRQAVLTWRKD